MNNKDKAGCLGCLGILMIIGTIGGVIAAFTKGIEGGILSNLLKAIVLAILGIVLIKKAIKHDKYAEENEENNNSKSPKDNNEKNDDRKVNNKKSNVIKEKKHQVNNEEVKGESVKENQQFDKKCEVAQIGNENITNQEDTSEPLKSVRKKLDLNYTKARKINDSFVVIDFKTTGLNYEEDEIIQYGLVEFKNGVIVHEECKYFQPYFNEVSEVVENITGISNEFLADKPILTKEALVSLLDQIEGKTVVAHNAPFDMKFLLYNLFEFNVEHKKFRVFDTLTYARKHISGTANYKLATLNKKFNLADGSAHDALNDARATGQLALLLIKKMNQTK